MAHEWRAQPVINQLSSVVLFSCRLWDGSATRDRHNHARCVVLPDAPAVVLRVLYGHGAKSAYPHRRSAQPAVAGIADLGVRRHIGYISPISRRIWACCRFAGEWFATPLSS